MKSVLMVVSQSVFRDEEYAVPKAVFEAAGLAVTTASTAPGTATGRFGLLAHPTISVAEAAGRPWDAVVFIGGGGARVFFDDTDAHALATAVVGRDGVLAAICIAPSTLAHAGLLHGVRATAFETQRDDLVAHGAIWTGDPVTIDGAIITANGPEAAEAFGEAITAALEG